MARSRKRTILTGLAYGVAVGAPTAVFAILLASGGASLPLELASDVPRAIVDADAALLGFLGLIAVYALTANNDSFRFTQQEIYRVKEEHEKELGIDIPETSQISENQLAQADQEYDLYKKRVKQLKKNLEDIREDSQSICFFSVVVAMSTIISILSAILTISITIPEIRFLAIYLATSFCILGVFFILLLIRDIGQRIAKE
jgi:hypothetical protein